MFYTASDDSHNEIQVNIIVPREWEAKEVHFRWNSSSEAMLLDLSGNVLQGFVCKHREFFTLSKSWGSHKDSDNVQFYVEMACNGLFGALGDGFSIGETLHGSSF